MKKRSIVQKLFAIAAGDLGGGGGDGDDHIRAVGDGLVGQLLQGEESVALTGLDYVTGTSDALNTRFIIDLMLAQNPELWRRRSGRRSRPAAAPRPGRSRPGRRGPSA